MHRVLIANRGEIAVRIIRACRESRLETVAVYSDADAASLHVAAADHAVHVGGAAAVDSYLSVGKLIDAARQSGADAVHPGYGFLAEDAAFAAACLDAGLVFVGPPPDVIASMGSKTAARDLMRQAGLPIVPGRHATDQTEAGLMAAAEDVGYPLVIKATAGGGGKGMRVVRTAQGLQEALGAARREATAAFGNGHLYLERLIEHARHVEVQVFADHHDHVVHLFERECSAQRRHQKVIEESPAPALSGTLRGRMGEAAVMAARAVGYRNAGTIEFLVEGEGDGARFFFLEMNTRLQVEHGVTEAVTGVDIVRWQLAVAAGATLPCTQAQITQRGHAVECRIYAEDAAQGFLPQAGTLLVYREPRGPGLRVDAGVREGDPVTVYYDPLIAKLIAYAESRDAALDRALLALADFPVLGVTNNIPFLKRILSHPSFRSGPVDTTFLEREMATLAAPASRDIEYIAAAAAGSFQVRSTDKAFPADAGGRDPWSTLTNWRGH